VRILEVCVCLHTIVFRTIIVYYYYYYYYWYDHWKC